MSRKLKIWLDVCFGIIALGIVTYIVLARWMNTSSTGTVHVGSQASQTPTESLPVTLSTQYFTAQLPPGFSEKRRTEKPSSGGTLLQLLATGGQNNQQTVAITVGTLPGDGLSGVGDYNLRASQPASYERFDPTALPSAAVAYRNTAGAAGFVVFWPNGARYTELSFNGEGGATLQQLQTTYLQVIGSWRAK